jgi:arylsulfatase
MAAASACKQEYKPPEKFKGGTIFGVGVTVEKTQYLSLGKGGPAMLSVE